MCVETRSANFGPRRVGDYATDKWRGDAPLHSLYSLRNPDGLRKNGGSDQERCIRSGQSRVAWMICRMAMLFWPREMKCGAVLLSCPEKVTERCIRICLHFRKIDCINFIWDYSQKLTTTLKRPYRGGNKGLYVLLSMTQAGPGRTVKQEQEEISLNHVQTFISPSVV